jgi:hypothetical protein
MPTQRKVIMSKAPPGGLLRVVPVSSKLDHGRRRVGDDYVDAMGDEVTGKLGQPLVPALSRSPLHNEVLPLHIAGIAQAVAQQ